MVIKVEAYGDDFKTVLKYLQRAIGDTSDSCSMSDGGYGVECTEYTDNDEIRPQSPKWSTLKRGE